MLILDIKHIGQELVSLLWVSCGTTCWSYAASLIKRICIFFSDKKVLTSKETFDHLDWPRTFSSGGERGRKKKNLYRRVEFDCFNHLVQAGSEWSL